MTRIRSMDCLVLAAVLAGPACSADDGSEVTKAAKPPESRVVVRYEKPQPGAGLSLLIRLREDGSAELQRVSATAAPDGRALTPRRSAKDWRRSSVAGEELIVTTHGKRGKLLAAYGYPLTRVEFYDTLSSAERGGLDGAVTGSAATTTLIRVPFLRDARYLLVVRMRRTTTRGDSPTASARRLTGPTGLPIFEAPAGGTNDSELLRFEPLGVLLLTASERPVGLDLPGIFPRDPLNIDPRILKHVLGEMRSLERAEKLGWRTATSTADGTTDEIDVPPPWHDSGVAPASAFNVVITGDGFQPAELCDEAAIRSDCCDETGNGECCTGDLCDFCLANPGRCCDYMDRACRVKRVLTTPMTHLGGGVEQTAFSLLSHKINIYRVDQPSEQSGVDYCPERCLTEPCLECSGSTPCPGCLSPDVAENPKTTVYEVAGNAWRLGQCTNFTSDVARLHDAASAQIDPSLVDVYVVLVNCDRYGAKVDFDDHVVYMATWDEACPWFGVGIFEHTVLHELGHAVAHLGEEDIRGAIPCGLASSTHCVPNCPAEFPNIATAAQVDAGQVPWAHLVRPEEKTANGELYKEAYPQHNDCVFVDGNRLGLFWGAQFVEPQGAGTQCGTSPHNACLDLDTAPCDDRGRDYYRPMASCRMRNALSPFCRVCDCTLWNLIADDTETPRSQRPECNPPTPPPNVTGVRVE